MAEQSDTQIESCLRMLQAGDENAKDLLIEHSCERLRRLARKQLSGFPLVKRWEDTDDVLQAALLKLHRSLDEVKPDTVRGYFGLAATQIRRRLTDLARKHGGPQGIGSNHATNAAKDDERGPERYDIGDQQDGPTTLSQWTSFHEAVGTLPDPQRECFDLLFYQDMKQHEAAEVLNVDVRTVKRRWRDAKLTLQEQLGEAIPA